METGRERTRERKERLKAVLAQRQPDLTLVLANIHDPHNVSAIYRSCDAFGVAAVHLYYTDTAFPALSKKTSASARKWVETVRHSEIQSLAQALTGYQVLATSCSATAQDMRSWDLTQKTAFIMGNEHRGVSADLCSIATGEIYIPMHGMIQSFNVSVAAALLLAEAARQRELAGFYAQPRYPEDVLRAKYEEWLEK